MAQELNLYDLGREIQDNGGWEEFHQRRHNYTMYDHYFSRRKRLEARYLACSKQQRRNSHD